MKVSAEESLWLAFPILLVVVVLVAGIFYLQRTNVDVRSRASEPTPALITPQITKGLPQAPEVVCAQIYEPVCGLNNKTYSNSCEANLDGVTNFTKGVCVTPTQIPLPQSN